MLDISRDPSSAFARSDPLLPQTIAGETSMRFLIIAAFARFSSNDLWVKCSSISHYIFFADFTKRLRNPFHMQMTF